MYLVVIYCIHFGCCFC